MNNRKMGERRLGAATLPTSRYDLFYYQIKSLRYEDGGNATGDVNADDAGQQQTGDKSSAVAVQQTITPAAEGNKDANSQIEAFKAKAVDETAKRQAAEQQVTDLTQQMQVMAANPQVQPATVQPQNQTLTVYDQARADLGLQDEEFLSETDRGRVIQRTIEIQSAANQQQQQAVSNQRFIQEHADYGEVVGRQMGNNFQLSPELLKIITEKPHLANAAYSNSESAYKVVMDERKLAELEKNATANKEHLARQGIDNKTEPLGGSAAGGGGAGDPNNQQMMSREKVLEIQRKLAAGEPV